MEPASRAVAHYIITRLGAKNEVLIWTKPLPPHVSYPEAFGLSPLLEIIAVIRDPAEVLLINGVSTCT